MWTILAGIFLILHGLVHLLYAGQSRRLFEMRPGLAWPDGAWAFSRLIGNESTRLLATVLLALAALGFAAGGLGLLFRGGWWRPAAASAAVLSMAIFALFWDGRLQAMHDKGWIGVLIDVVVLVIVLITKWPA